MIKIGQLVRFIGNGGNFYTWNPDMSPPGRPYTMMEYGQIGMLVKQVDEVGVYLFGDKLVPMVSSYVRKYNGE